MSHFTAEGRVREPMGLFDLLIFEKSMVFLQHLLRISTFSFQAMGKTPLRITITSLFWSFLRFGSGAYIGILFLVMFCDPQFTRIRNFYTDFGSPTEERKDIPHGAAAVPGRSKEEQTQYLVNYRAILREIVEDPSTTESQRQVFLKQIHDLSVQITKIDPSRANDTGDVLPLPSQDPTLEAQHYLAPAVTLVGSILFFIAMFFAPELENLWGRIERKYGAPGLGRHIVFFILSCGVVGLTLGALLVKLSATIEPVVSASPFLALISSAVILISSVLVHFGRARLFPLDWAIAVPIQKSAVSLGGATATVASGLRFGFLGNRIDAAAAVEVAPGELVALTYCICLSLILVVLCVVQMTYAEALKRGKMEGRDLLFLLRSVLAIAAAACAVGTSAALYAIYLVAEAVR